MKRIGRKSLTSAILLAMFMILLLMQLVRANPINVSVSPSSGPVGTSVVVSGVADTSGGTVNIYFDIDGDGLTEQEEFQTSVTASVEAPFSYEATITVPPSTAGTHAVISNDVDAGTSDGDSFTVMPKITIAPPSGPIGSVVTVSGGGFDGTSAVTITFGGSDVTSDPAPETDTFGSFSASFSVAPLVAGEYIVVATDAASNTDSTIFTLLGITISIDQTSGPVGTVLSISGSQATPGGMVTVWWDDTSKGSVAAGADGAYSFEFTVPPSAVGEHDVKTEDQASTNTATQTFTVEPQIILNKVEGPVATELSVTGTGFAANGLVDITFDTTLVVDDFATDSTGSFTATFNVPASVAGSHTVTATDTADSTVTASALFTVIPKITLDVTEGPIGTEVQVTGTGFAGANSIVITFNSVDVTPSSAPETDEVGSFAATFIIPPLPAGDHTITAIDEAENQATATFTLWGINVSITPTSGPVGTIVSVTGTYATPGGSVTIRWDSIEIITIAAQLDGAYSYDLTVPASVTGDHTVTIVDLESTNTAVKTYTVEPQIILTPEDGIVGGSILVMGTGFSGASQVDVYFDSDKDGLPDAEELMLDNVSTDEFGSFDQSFNVPEVSTAGNYLVIAVDEEEVTDDATFTVLFVMYTRGDEYFQGDYPSFFIQVVTDTGAPSEGTIVIIEVFDSSGYRQYKGVTITETDGTIPYDMQFFNWWIWNNAENFELSPLHLPSDALTGTWTWTTMTGGLTINGSFEVIEPVDLRTLLEKLDQLLDNQTDIADLISHYGDKLQLEHEELAELISSVSDKLQLDIEDLVELIDNVADKLQLEHEGLATLVTEVFSDLDIKLDEISAQMMGIEEKVDGLYLVIGDLEVKFDDIDAKLTDVQNDVATISTSLGEIQVSLENIDAEIVEIKASIVTIKTDIGTIEVTLEDVQAELVDIQEGIAVITTTLGEIETKIDNLGAVSLEEIKSDIATIKSDIGTIKVNVNNINANITSIKGRLVTIETTVGTIQEDIDDINGKIVAIEGETATVKTDIGTVKTSLTDINTKITVSKDNIATIQTDIGTIKGRLTTIEGDVAAIETDIGTVKTSTGNIESTGESIKSDTSLQMPGVALSLIAAVGAIAAAAMILRKVYMK